METTGERVTRLRTALELTQDQLAKKAGVAQSTINGIEKGARQKMPSSLIEIAHALGVDAYWLKTGKGKQEPISAPPADREYGIATSRNPRQLTAAEPSPAEIVSFPSPLLAELAEVSSHINDAGLHRLIAHAQNLADQFPRINKGNAAN